MKNKPTLEENAGRLAKKAADIIEDTGWVRGKLEAEDNRVCIRGAMSKVAANGKTNKVTYSHDKEALIISQWFHKNVPNHLIPGLPVQFYNDNVFTSQEEVVSWLRKAGEALDRKK